MKNIEPCVFGPIVWTIFHLMSFSYEPTNEQDKQNMKNFILSTGNILPCDACRTHFLENINTPLNGQTLDTALNSSETFQKYIYDFHNLVNEQTGKPTDMTFEQVQSIYDPLIKKASCSIDSCHSDSNDVYCKIEFYKKQNLPVIFMAIITILMLIGFYVYYTRPSKKVTGRK